MTLISKKLSGRPYNLQLNVTHRETDAGGNRSRYNYEISVKSLDGYGTFKYDAVSARATINGVAYNKTRASLNFVPDSKNKTLVIGSGVTDWINHDADGRKTFNIRVQTTGSWGVFGSADTGNSPYVATRIPKPPAAPGGLALGTITTTSVALSWSKPGDNGAAINGYEIQRATNAAFTQGVATTDVSGTSGTVSGIATGTRYWFRVRARNSAGWGGWSAAVATATKPAAPGNLRSSNVTPTSFTLDWNSPGGNGITRYEIQRSTASNFAGPTNWEQTGTSLNVSGLSPATTYYFRVHAETLGGFGAWSATFKITPGLPAPTLNSAATETGNYRLRVAWSAPSITTGLTGYRVQTATDAAFTKNVQHNDVGNVLTTDLTRTGGKRYWVRVAARTAGGVNTWSGSRAVVHQLAAGNVDSWTRVGAKPAAIAYYTQSGIRRGATGGRQALILESLSTGNVTLAADTFGIQRKITGLKIGHAYRFEASGNLLGAALGGTYRLRVLGEVAAAPVTLTTAPQSLGYVEFIASATTATLQILLADPITVSGAQDIVENAAFHGIRLLELATDYPVRLRETVYESNLANHLDLACNSVGASWFVAKDGVTRFRLPGSTLPLRGVFTDDDTPDALHYVDIAAARDTRGMFNRLDVTNYGVTDESGERREENDELVVTSSASITRYGTRSARLEANLYSQPPYGQTLNERLDELLAENDEPQFLMSEIRWNAQENLDAAAALEVGQRIIVRRKGHEQDSQIVHIQHHITPTRWMVQLGLRKVGS